MVNSDQLEGPSLGNLMPNSRSIRRFQAVLRFWIREVLRAPKMDVPAISRSVVWLPRSGRCAASVTFNASCGRICGPRGHALIDLVEVTPWHSQLTGCVCVCFFWFPLLLRLYEERHHKPQAMNHFGNFLLILEEVGPEFRAEPVLKPACNRPLFHMATGQVGEG